MGLMDDFLKGGGGVGSIAQLAAQNPQIVAAAVSLLSTKDRSVGGTSGLAGMISAFQGGGLGDIMSSWISTGANQSISPSQLGSVLGNDTLSQFAQKAGIGQGEASSVLASLLPSLVNQLTPKGNVPETNSLEDTLGGLLSSLGR
jgi:uncharacterized protein YidB (DUF937 family)